MSLPPAMSEQVAPALLCHVSDLTVSNAAALHQFLMQAQLQDVPVDLSLTQEVDLAGVQLLLAFALQRRQSGRPIFGRPLPSVLVQAWALAGCDDGLL